MLFAATLRTLSSPRRPAHSVSHNPSKRVTKNHRSLGQNVVQERFTEDDRAWIALVEGVGVPNLGLEGMIGCVASPDAL